MTPTSGGTQVINGWYQAIITWALVLAVGAIVVSAAMWAVGNLRYTPQTSSRGKWGVVVAVAAAMLLGGSKVYLQYLYDKWAPAFAPDPASYAVADAPNTDRYTVIDRSDAWNAKITEMRTAAGVNDPLLTDPQLRSFATECAKALIGAPDAQCDTDQVYWAATYTSAQITLLDGLPKPDQVDFLLQPTPDLKDTSSPDGDFQPRRAAWVAVEDNETKHAKLVALFANGPCNGSCVGADGHLHKPVITIIPIHGDVTDSPPIGGG